MAYKEHHQILEQGVEVWNKWRNENPDIVPDLYMSHFLEKNLSGVNLSKAILTGSNLDKSDLSSTDLSGANFINASLVDVNFKGSYITETDFSGADLSGANFINANLRQANFSDTIIRLTNFSHASLINAKFNGARLLQTNLVDCNLSDVEGLESCTHRNYSAIDHRTLALSGNLPISFLRGCGLPDFIIENIQVLQNSPFIFYSCFISHSTKDQEFANRLYADLQNKGIRCWYAPEDMKGGKKLFDQINEAIRIHDKLLLVLSEESMSSNWVATEVKKALKREKQDSKQMLFPISITPFNNIQEWELFDNDEGKDLAAEIRSYFIPDFSEWKNHDTYNKVFDKLANALKGNRKKQTG